MSAFKVGEQNGKISLDRIQTSVGEGRREECCLGPEMRSLVKRVVKAPSVMAAEMEMSLAVGEPC